MSTRPRTEASSSASDLSVAVPAGRYGWWQRSLNMPEPLVHSNQACSCSQHDAVRYEIPGRQERSCPSPTCCVSSRSLLTLDNQHNPSTLATEGDPP